MNRHIEQVRIIDPSEIITDCPKCKWKFERTSKPEYIVVHYPGNTACAINQCKYYSRCDRVVSAHFVVDNDGKIYNPLPVIYGAYHVVSSKKCANKNSISIDMCCRKIDETKKGAYDNDWFHEYLCLMSARALVFYLMKKYDIPVYRVLRHYDVTKKHCPATMCGNDINRFTGVSGNELWECFKSGLNLDYIGNKHE